MHRVGDKQRLEYPIGHVLYQTTDDLLVRVVPGGRFATRGMVDGENSSPFRTLSLDRPRRRKRTVSRRAGKTGRTRSWSARPPDTLFGVAPGRVDGLRAVSLDRA